MFIANNTQLFILTDTNNKDPKSKSYQEVPLLSFPEFGTVATATSTESYSSEHEQVLMAGKSYAPVTITTTQSQTLDDLAESRKHFQLKIQMKDNGVADETVNFAIYNGFISSSSVSSDYDQVVQKLYTFEPQELVQRGVQYPIVQRLERGQFGLGANGVDWPQNMETDGNGLILASDGTHSVHFRHGDQHTEIRTDGLHTHVTSYKDGTTPSLIKLYSEVDKPTPSEIGAIPVSERETFVPRTLTVNGHQLVGDISLNAQDLGNVYDKTQVNDLVSPKLNKAGDTMSGSLSFSSTSNPTYDIYSNSNDATDSKRYLRQFRSSRPATIWHETIEDNKYRLATGKTDSVTALELTADGQLFLAGARAYTTAYKPTYGDVGAAPGGFGLGTIARNTNANTETLGGFWRDVSIATAGITLPYDGTPSQAFIGVDMQTGKLKYGVRSGSTSTPINWRYIYSENNKPPVDITGAVVASVTNVSTQDWNTLTTAGSYCVSNATGTNFPSVVGHTKVYNYGVLSVQKSLSIVTQVYIPEGRGNIYIRNAWNDNWREWKVLQSDDSAPIESSFDLDNLTLSGNYNLYRGGGVTFTNCPSDFDFGTLQVIGRGTAARSFVTQILTWRANGRQMIRTRNDGAMAWTQWTRIYSDAQKPSAADVGALPVNEKAINTLSLAVQRNTQTIALEVGDDKTPYISCNWAYRAIAFNTTAKSATFSGDIFATSMRAINKNKAITLESNGTNKYNISVRSWGSTGSRDTVFEVGDDKGYYFYAQRSSDSAAIELCCAGNINCNSLFQRSDARVKSNIVELTDVLAKLTKIHGYSYVLNGAEKQIGLIAQEVQPMFPDLVIEQPQYDENGNPTQSLLALNYSGFTGVLVQAVNDLNAIQQAQQNKITDMTKTIDQLQQTINTKVNSTDIDALVNRITALENRITALETKTIPVTPDTSTSTSTSTK
ncbi:pyocin knob domain-containing S74 family peptidase [Edwardsiella tarda]|uniref:pyocin knob domain-containing S74 family peptidase n=1 Tax=Edwardsiella tarda TaxID=636 RepID=UPI00351C960F